MNWLDIAPSTISHILITHQDTDHVGAVETDSDGLFQNATLYLSEIENKYLTGEVRRKVIFGLYNRMKQRFKIGVSDSTRSQPKAICAVIEISTKKSSASTS